MTPVAGVVVRPMTTSDDAQAAGEVVRRAYFALPGYPRHPGYDVTIGDVAARAGDSVVVIALIDARVVGCCTYVGDHTSPHAEFDDPHASSFRYFGVDPEVQGRGVGEAMVRWCIDRARADGKRCIRIHTLESMPAAQRMYLRLGFERDPDHDEDWDGIAGLAFVYRLDV